MHQGKVSAKGDFQQIRFSINLDLLFAFLDSGADARLCQHPRPSHNRLRECVR